MGIKEKRAKYKEEFRREILDAARELFLNEGYEKFSMRKLAEKIGYSPTSIYLYFKGKDDLLFAICEEFAERFVTTLNDIRSRSNDPLDALRQAMLYRIEFGLNNPNQYRVFYFSNPHVYGTGEDFMKRESIARNSYFVFREMVQECIETGKFRDLGAEVITQSLAAAAHGLIAANIFVKSFPWADQNTLANALVDGLLRGFQK
jgi:AcrR family transcriptional regulator